MSIKNLRKQEKGSKGITLIALVITIIVLLILAGISINALFGENGLLNRASTTKEEYSKSEVKEKVSLLLNEYIMEKITEESSDFAKFLRKNLQVGIVENEDDTYSFMLGEWQVVTTESKVISIEKFKLNVDKTYTSVAAMKVDTELIEGKLVKTEGYWDKAYGGSAYYDIVSSTSLTVDNGKCIQLDNGLYAKLHAINDTVTVNQFGAYGDGEHDDAKAISSALNAGFPYIMFEKKENYRINSKVYIKNSNISVFGNDAMIFYDNQYNFYTDTGFKQDEIVLIYNTDSDYIHDIYVNKLNFTNKGTTTLHQVIRMKYAENIEISECHLESTNIGGKKETVYTNFDLRDYWNNIYIHNCELINTTQSNAGGTIWIRAGKQGTGNIIMENNYIKKSCHDESIAVFAAPGEGGVVSNVTIKDNVFDIDDTNVENPSSIVINFGNNTDRIDNIKFINNKLDVKASRRFIGIYNATNVLISNNIMNITSLSDAPYSDWFLQDENSNEVEFSNNVLHLTNTLGVNNRVFRGINKINNNQININMHLNTLFSMSNEICNNKVNISNELIEDKYPLSIIQYKSDTPLLVKNNIFDFEKISNREIRLFSFYNSYINNHMVNIEDNIISELENQSNQYMIYFQDMQDTNPQKIYLKNNNFGFFTLIGNYNNLTTYSIIEK